MATTASADTRSVYVPSVAGGRGGGGGGGGGFNMTDAFAHFLPLPDLQLVYSSVIALRMAGRHSEVCDEVTLFSFCCFVLILVLKLVCKYAVAYKE